MKEKVPWRGEECPRLGMDYTPKVQAAGNSQVKTVIGAHSPPVPIQRKCPNQTTFKRGRFLLSKKKTIK